MLKLMLFSGVAVVPLYFLSPILLNLFAGKGRVISYGMPLAANAVIFALLGIGLLFITRDRQLGALVRIVKRRTPKNAQR